LASWMERVCDVGGNATAAAPAANTTTNVASSSSQLIFFCDAVTAASVIQRLVSVREGDHFRNMRRCAAVCGGTITFIVVRDPALGGRDYDAVRRRLPVESSMMLRLQEVLDHHVVFVNRAAYMDEPWITSVPNGANNFRFAFYRDWLSRWFEQMSDASTKLRVLIADNTDVAFQRNPFESSDTGNGCFPAHGSAPPPPAGSDLRHESSTTVPLHRNQTARLSGGDDELPWVTFTLEDASKSFKNEKYNRRWVGCYSKAGEPALKQMESTRQRVSCAGVTLGNGQGALHYCKAQVKELTRAALVSCAMTTIRATLDQASHNVLLHRWLQWSTAAYGRDLSHGGAPAWMGPLSTHRRHFGGSGHLLNRWTAYKLGASSIKELGHPPGGFYLFTATAEASAEMDGGDERGRWIPCVFHGNFGTPSFASSGRLQDQGLHAQQPMPGGGKREPMFALVHQYTSNRVPVMMDLMRRLYL
jgi:hypothetical protein